MTIDERIKSIDLQQQQLECKKENLFGLNHQVTRLNFVYKLSRRVKKKNKKRQEKKSKLEKLAQKVKTLPFCCLLFYTSGASW